MSINIPKTELEEYYINQCLSSRKIAKIYNCAYSTIDRKIKECGFKTRNLSQAHIIYPRKNFSGDLVEKAYLLGFTIGDLRVRKVYKHSETIHVDCGSTKDEQIKLIKNLFNTYGRVWISKPGKNRKYQIEAFLNDSFDFLIDCKLKAIEKWILSKQEYFASFLAGFTDAEGSIFLSSNRIFYALGNYNFNLLIQIQKALGTFNILSPKITRSVRKGLVASHGYKYNNDYWNLVITRKSEVLKLINFLEPYLHHDKRKRDLQKAKIHLNLIHQYDK